MAEDSQFALQTAIYDALRTDATLITLAGDGASPERAKVYDQVEQDTAFPYVVIGPTTTLPWDSKTSDGMEHLFDVFTLSRYGGLKEIKDMMAAVVDALDNVTLTVTGHTLVLLQFTFGQTVNDGDGLTHEGITRFRALIQTP